jgi:tRNA (guanine37-N1)-methyltransferase
MARGVRSWCVVVPRERGEEVRQRLKERGLLQKHLKVREAAGRLYLPTTERADVGWPTEERECEEAFAPIRSYKEVARVPDSLRDQLPTSFDVIGDIAVLKIPEPLLPYRTDIGRAILEWNPTLKVVAQDHGVAGAFRVRNLDILAGERRTTTVHTEFGLRYHADVAQAYFSPRLGSERLRVAEQVEPGESIADPFAGVGPYAILIAKRRAPARVVASDANPVAVAFLRQNVAANRADRVEVREGDARAILREIAPVDRIILDLPHSAMDFLPDALATLGPHGTIHVYGILEDADRDDRIRAIQAAVEGCRRHVESVRPHIVRAYSPTQHHVAFDVTVGPG